MTLALVADDETRYCVLVGKQLEQMGIKSVLAFNAEQTLEEAQTKPVDLIVTDLTMPGRISGEELLSKLSKVKPGCPIIVMTGFPSDAVNDLCARLNVADYLIKPFEMNNFREVVRRALCRSH